MSYLPLGAQSDWTHRLIYYAYQNLRLKDWFQKCDAVFRTRKFVHNLQLALYNIGKAVYQLVNK